MSSQNKKNKLRNSYQVNTALKDKRKGIKRLTFYTSSQRQENKKFAYWPEQWNDNRGNRRLIQTDFLLNGGKFVKLDYGKPGILVGVLEDDYDWYWIIEDVDLKLVVSSCVGSMRPVEDDELPPECFTLVWMQKNDKEGLMERVNEQLKKYLDSGDRIMIGLVIDDDRDSWEI